MNSQYTQRCGKLIQIFLQTNWIAVVLKLMNSNEQSFTVWQAIIAIHQCFKFLTLMFQQSDIRFVPNKEIDAVIHILELHPVFNRYFDHQPGLGTRGEADRQEWLQAFQATRELFERRFGIGSMGNAQPARCEIVERQAHSFSRCQPASCEICLKAAEIAI